MGFPLGATVCVLLLTPAASAAGGVRLSLGDDQYVVAFSAIVAENVSYSRGGVIAASPVEAVSPPSESGMISFRSSVPWDAQSYSVGTRAFNLSGKPPGAGGSARVAFVADWGRSDDSWRVLEGITRSKPDLLLVGGDASYANGAAEKWDAWLSRIEPLVSGIPMMMAFGNHESYCASGPDLATLETCALEAARYSQLFHMPNAPHHYYDFAWGSARFVALDTEAYHGPSNPRLPNESDPAAQEAFLTTTLATDASAWQIAFFHRPLYTTHSKGADVVARERLEPLFAGVDLALAGHVHAYERTAPINGTTHIVSGGGGRSLYHDWGPPANWSVNRSAEFEFVLLDYSSTRLRVQAIRPDGTILDSFTMGAQETVALRATPGAEVWVAILATLIGMAARRPLRR